MGSDDMRHTLIVLMRQNLFCHLGRDHFDWGPPWLRKASRALFQVFLAFALQLKKNTEDLSQFRRLALDTNSCVDLAAFLGATLISLSSISRLRLPVADFSQPTFRNKIFPTSANLELKLPVSDLMRSAKNRVPKSSWICLLLAYKSAYF
jgi:hypothetical protein